MVTDKDFQFDNERGAVSVCGVAYSYELFESWGENGIAVNKLFKLIGREKDGAITVQIIEE